ncbi:NAD(P)-binding domain-containing protein [Piscinibacter sp. XHJ-5]|uniref:NADPH-dependent F420 reductase n=1 Tax=Piscinibacter sp. XHJ-5 TaxID=3037797 RepID=UPI002452FFFC|nr:NAD(P)-binding domain-containing protein [Piscinibacter sp. XHJ-5]
MKIGILGSGSVAQSLGAGLLQHGHDVVLGTGSPAKLAEWQAAHPRARVGTFADAAGFGDIAVLAVKGHAAVAAVRAAGAHLLAGKTIIDTTNPIADEPPLHGVLRFFTGPGESLHEQLQREYPELKFVKAFNSVGAAHMIDPSFEGGPPTMFICGDDERARHAVGGLVRELGWEVADMGPAVAARAIEPLCMLWCIPGLQRNEWSHAFRLLK